MLKLDSLSQWNTDNFSSALKQELQHLKAGTLPLHKATNQGGIVDDSNLSVTVLTAHEYDEHIEIIIGVFFNEIIGGCNCHDDPVSENSYCEIMLNIDKQSELAQFTLLSN